MSLTESLMQVLRDGQWHSTESLRQLTGISRGQAGALLAYSIKQGRVIKSADWPRRYRAATPKEQKKEAIQRAITLLRNNGYAVEGDL